jgi:hypothetical protein
MITYDSVDFHPRWNREHNVLSMLLRDHFPLLFAPGNADFLFYGDHGSEHREEKHRRCIKIYYTEENRWNHLRERSERLEESDYALGPEYSSHPNRIRLPPYVAYLLHSGRSLVRAKHPSPRRELASKTKFCNFIFSNEHAPERTELLNMLGRYKRVDSGGAVANNLGYQVRHKLSFIRDYKFTIAFENSSYPGYVTEKIVEPMLQGSLPIYWGNPLVGEDFNPRSFIDATHADLEDVVEQVVAADRDDVLYLRYMSEPPFRDNQPSPCCRPDYLLPFFSRVFGCPIRHQDDLS